MNWLKKYKLKPKSFYSRIQRHVQRWRPSKAFQNCPVRQRVILIHNQKVYWPIVCCCMARSSAKIAFSVSSAEPMNYRKFQLEFNRNISLHIFTLHSHWCDCTIADSLIEMGEALRQMADVKYSLDDNIKQNFLEPLHHLQTKDLKEVMVSILYHQTKCDRFLNKAHLCNSIIRLTFRTTWHKTIYPVNSLCIFIFTVSPTFWSAASS